MVDLRIAHRRLGNQHIASPTFEKPEEVVRWMGAVQAQEFAGALWAIGLRTRNATAADVEQAMADGRIVRAHPMRGTWHFVPGEDLRWHLSLTTRRRIAQTAYYYRQLELDDAILAASNEVFARTLRGGKQLIRPELAAALEQAGISTRDLRLTFLLSYAELSGVICSGARRGKQFTYALLDEVVPASRKLDHDEALAELTRRYFTSHGPATPQDFAWWSGLTVNDARTGLSMNSACLEREIIDGQDYWFAPSLPCAQIAATSTHLLPTYDEYTVAYKDRSSIFDAAYTDKLDPRGGILANVIAINGEIVGTWKRAVKKDAIVLAPQFFRSLDEAEAHAFMASVSRYGTCFGTNVIILPDRRTLAGRPLEVL